MNPAALLRAHIEEKIPSAFAASRRMELKTLSTGIAEIDALTGGIPLFPFHFSATLLHWLVSFLHLECAADSIIARSARPAVSSHLTCDRAYGAIRIVAMKKSNPVQNNGLRDEYDFASMKGGVRGKYVRRFREGSNIVLLEPEVAEAFPTEDAVNEALRGVLKTAQAVRRTGGLANKTLKGVSPSRHKKTTSGR